MRIDQLLGNPELKDFLEELRIANEECMKTEKEYQKAFVDMTDARDNRSKIKDKLMKYLEENLGTKL